MKKLIMLFLLLGTMSFGLEITRVDQLDFGTVVKGDKKIRLDNVRVDVKGRSGRNVEIIVDDRYDLGGNTMFIDVRDKKIRLDGSGKGVFKLDVRLDLKDTSNYETLRDQLSVKVRYVK